MLINQLYRFVAPGDVGRQLLELYQQAFAQIGGADTGYQWDHPALKNGYRGWNGVAANHDYNWHDSIHAGGGVCGPNMSQPCDDQGHGTHTMGTAVGDEQPRPTLVVGLRIQRGQRN